MEPTKNKKSEAAWNLRLAKAYWLQTVQPYINGRKLGGAEFFVAMDAHRRLSTAWADNIKWNGTKNGANSPVSVELLIEWKADEFREPEQLCRDENLKPETLAQIAAPFLRDKWTNLKPADAIREAHKLSIEAEHYIGTLPTQKRGTERLIEKTNLAFGLVSFSEILQSSDEKLAQVPLLMGVQKKRSKLTMPALKKAVSRFWKSEKENASQGTEKEWNSEIEQNDRLAEVGMLLRPGGGKPQTYKEWKTQRDKAINDCVNNQQIYLQHLCKLRWQRFKTFWENQSARRRHDTAKPRKPKIAKK